MSLFNKQSPSPVSSRLSRRTLLGTVAALTCAACAPGISAQTPLAAPSGKLILLGTQGGPNFSLTRGETASALIVGERHYLIDCGYGTRAALLRAAISQHAIDAIFLTHLHDDHTSDLLPLLTNMATQTRTRTITVYGPPGTNELVDALRAVMMVNARIRIADEARQGDFLGFIESEEVAPGAPFLQEGEMRVSCAENSHYPDEIEELKEQGSFAYRFDWGRSVVFSGDTTYSERLAALAKGADVFVCELIEPVSMRQAFEKMLARGDFAGSEEGVWQHIIGTHSSPEQTGRMATEAGVGHLVINHFVPGALLETPDSTIQELLGAYFSGPVTIGRDNMVIEI